ncbi:hypothetical protein CYMTET_34464, partial [Cymbomonas tetramitiformis]
HSRLTPSRKAAASDNVADDGSSEISDAVEKLAEVKPDDLEKVAKSQAISALAGGVVLHLALGTLYIWGNIAPFVTSYLRQFDPNVTASDTLFVFATALMGLSFSLTFGGRMERKIGPKWTAMIGGYIMAASTFAAAQCRSVGALITVYGLVFGVGTGIAYSAPLVCGLRHLPTQKGLVSGIITAGFGAGAFLFNYISTWLVNPAGHAPVGGYFGPEVTANIPFMFNALGCCYFLMVTLAGFLLKNPSPEVLAARQQAAASGTQPALADDTCHIAPGDMFGEPQAWLLWVCFFLTSIGGIFVLGSYKSFGSFFSQQYLVALGAWASIFNACGRLAWGQLADRTSYKIALSTMTACLGTLLLCYSFTTFSAPLFFAVTCALVFCYGGNFSLYPTATATLFGSLNAGPNYGLIFTGLGFASVASIFFGNKIVSVLGMAGVTQVYGLVCLLGCFLTIKFMNTPETCSVPS